MADFTLTINANATAATRTFTFAPTDDAAAEGGESVTVSGAVAGDELAVVGAVLRIADGDRASSRVGLSLSPGAAAEAGGSTDVVLTATLDGTARATATPVRVRVGWLPPRVSLGTPELATVHLVDDDARGVTVSAEGLSIPEGENRHYTVVLGSEPTGEVVVTVDVPSDAPLTAAPPALTFTPASWRTSQTVTVTAPADDDAVIPEPVVLGHTVTGADYDGERAASLTVYVGDSTVPEVSLDRDAASVAENGGQVTFTATLGAASTRPVTVDYETADGTAVAGEDYVAASGSLTFEPGGALQHTLAATVLDDLRDEEQEQTFTLALTAPVGATLGDPRTATVTIADDDDVPTVSLPSRSLNVAEAGAGVWIDVSLSVASDRVVTVDYATSDGSTAQPGTVAARTVEDYAAASGTTTFAPGTTSHALRIAIHDDEIDEGASAAFTVTLSDPVNAGLGRASVPVHILDDDTVRVDIVPAVVTVREGDTAAAAAVLSIISELDTEFAYQTVDGTARAPIDYTASGKVALTVAAGRTRAAIAVPTAADDLDESDETFTVRVVDVDGATPDTLAFGAAATVTIVDGDDAPLLQVASTAGGVSEDAGTLPFTVSLDAPSALDVTVDYSVVGLSATAGEDFTEVADGTLTIAASAREAALSVTILQDEIYEATEILQLVLSNPVNARLPDAPGTGSILDDDATPVLTLGFELVDDTTSEDADEAESEDADDTESEDADATESEDADATESEDADDTESEDSDEAATPPATSIEVPEDGGSARVVASLTGVSSEPVSVRLLVQAELPARSEHFDVAWTPLDDDDLFGPENQVPRLWIAAGATKSTEPVTISAIPDKVDDPNRIVVVTGTVTGRDDLAAPAPVRLTIADDDDTPASVTLAVVPETIEESTGPTELTVTATLAQEVALASDTVLTVTVGAVSDSASSGSDYATPDAVGAHDSRVCPEGRDLVHVHADRGQAPRGRRTGLAHGRDIGTDRHGHGADPGRCQRGAEGQPAVRKLVDLRERRRDQDVGDAVASVQRTDGSVRTVGHAGTVRRPCADLPPPGRSRRGCGQQGLYADAQLPHHRSGRDLQSDDGDDQGRGQPGGRGGQGRYGERDRAERARRAGSRRGHSHHHGRRPGVDVGDAVAVAGARWPSRRRRRTWW